MSYIGSNGASQSFLEMYNPSDDLRSNYSHWIDLTPLTTNISNREFHNSQRKCDSIGTKQLAQLGKGLEGRKLETNARGCDWDSAIYFGFKVQI